MLAKTPGRRRPQLTSKLIQLSILYKQPQMPFPKPNAQIPFNFSPVYFSACPTAPRFSAHISLEYTLLPGSVSVHVPFPLLGIQHLLSSQLEGLFLIF